MYSILLLNNINERFASTGQKIIHPHNRIVMIIPWHGGFMPILKVLFELAESTVYDPTAPTWCIVNDLLLASAGAGTSLGAVVAASGECAMWS